MPMTKNHFYTFVSLHGSSGPAYWSNIKAVKGGTLQPFNLLDLNPAR